MPRDIVTLVFDDVQLLDVAGPADVFDAANRVVGTEVYRLHPVSPDGRKARASNGVVLEVEASLAAYDGAIDTLLIAGGWGSERLVLAPDVVASVRDAAGRARRVASVCTGAFVLAEAGLLDGRSATTHWARCRDLAAYDGVAVEADQLFVHDENVVTAAGVASGIDLALWLVERDLGAEVARTVARWLVVFLSRPGGQSQFSQRAQLPAISSGPIRMVVDMITANPAGDHRVERLASACGMSRRHFARAFRHHTGTTPAAYVEVVRVEAAKGLLESSSATQQRIARSVGFGSAEAMRQAFHRRLGVAPGDYRSRFATTG